MASIIKGMLGMMSLKEKEMQKICDGVEFDTIAREWRMKWSDNEVLKEVQVVLNQYIPGLKSTPGCTSVQRIVCGTCKDQCQVYILRWTSFLIF